MRTMKRAILATLAALGSTQSLGMDTDSLTRQWAYTALHVADWAQTRNIARSASVGGSWIETNPILGPRPSQARVNRYFVATLAAHWAISYNLSPALRREWQIGTIALQAIVVRNNYQLGISASF